jgi:hypothetical protein
METIVTINPEKVGDKYVFKVEQWQLDELRAGLIRLGKQRDSSNKNVEKNRIIKGVPKAKLKTMKPRLVIGDVILSNTEEVVYPVELSQILSSQEELMKQMLYSQTMLNQKINLATTQKPPSPPPLQITYAPMPAIRC